MSNSTRARPGRNLPRRYSITELLHMRRSLPYVCCPLGRFGTDAWDHKIVRVYPITREMFPSTDPEPSENRGEIQTYGTPVMARQQHQGRGGFTDLENDSGQYMYSAQRQHTIPTQAGRGDYPHRYFPTSMSSSMPSFNFPGTVGIPASMATLPSDLPVSPTSGAPRQELAQTMARVYPQPPVVSPYISGMNPPMAEAVSLAARAASLSLGSPMGSRRAVLDQLSGGYPGVTIGAAGYDQGRTLQGFVPGGTLKVGPVTGLTPTMEKTEVVWPKAAAAGPHTIIPHPPPITGYIHGPNDRVYRTQKSAAKALQHDSSSRQLTTSNKENLLSSPAQHAAASQPSDLQENRNVTKPVDEEIKLPPPPPPMLGTRSNREQQLAFIEFMKSRNQIRINRAKEKSSTDSSYSHVGSSGQDTAW